ncbi:unnamed protein product [Symbiodinium sp. KB8]|nr:unnamed protein product [Symbiodinium sp. KB8]
MACDIIKFYKWGMFLCLLIASIALYLAIKCPYASVCPAGFAAMMLTGISAALTGIVMFFVKRSLSHVRKLHIDDLSAKKITARTVRCGGIARKCPCWSRWLFFFMTVGVVSGFSIAVVLSTCPDAGDATLWKGELILAEGAPQSTEGGYPAAQTEQSGQAHSCCGANPEAAMGSQGLGQVLDLETGANETLGPELTEEAILQRFPKLRAPETPEDTAPRSDPGAEMDVEKTFDGNMAAQMVLAAVALQEERVAVYKDFDAAFKYLLQAEGQKATRALAWLYPFVVRCATVRFQVLQRSFLQRCPTFNFQHCGVHCYM